MNRGRLVLRLALIAVAAGVFFVRGGTRNPAMTKGFVAALVLALIVVAVRAALEASKKKKLEQERSLTADNQKVELFTKPKDF